MRQVGCAIRFCPHRRVQTIEQDCQQFCVGEQLFAPQQKLRYPTLSSLVSHCSRVISRTYWHLVGVGRCLVLVARCLSFSARELHFLFRSSVLSISFFWVAVVLTLDPKQIERCVHRASETCCLWDILAVDLMTSQTVPVTVPFRGLSISLHGTAAC